MLVPGTLVVLSNNNLICASGTFTNVFRANFAARSSLALIWYSISWRLNAPPVRILLQTAPHRKLYASDDISITDSLFVMLFLEKFMLFYHHWASIIDCGDKIIIASKHPFDILSAFVLSCSKYLLWAVPYFTPGRFGVIRSIAFATYLIIWLFLWISSVQQAFKVSFFVSVRVISNFCEFVLNPRYVISCFRENIDLSGWITNPIEFKSFIDAFY